MKKLFFILLFAFSTSLYSQVIPSDSLALVDLYNSCGGPNWDNKTNWLSINPVSTWYGVTVDTNINRVTEISLLEQ